jgi:hypothetical protein
MSKIKSKKLRGRVVHLADSAGVAHFAELLETVDFPGFNAGSRHFPNEF